MSFDDVRNSTPYSGRSFSPCVLNYLNIYIKIDFRKDTRGVHIRRFLLKNIPSSGSFCPSFLWWNCLHSRVKLPFSRRKDAQKSSVIRDILFRRSPKKRMSLPLKCLDDDQYAFTDLKKCKGYFFSRPKGILTSGMTVKNRRVSLDTESFPYFAWWCLSSFSG